MSDIISSSSFVFGFHEIDKTKLASAGGKGANLGELSRIEGIHVPEGFCISTEAFKTGIGKAQSINELLDRLSLLNPEDRNRINELSAEIRWAIEEASIPEAISNEIAAYISKYGKKDAYAVRSSATAEDLPGASFAGQQDTYLNIIGKDSILKHISKCWASLFTDRAISYRMQNGYDHRKVQMAVVVQKMIFSQVAGVLFTADPVTSNKVTSIDASFGLGEALVAGLVNADNYRARKGQIISKRISTKKLAIHASKEGGTIEREIDPQQQNAPALTDGQILQLEQLGRKIETHFGQPQDIEWCLADNTFYFVQARPITTLFPIPETDDPGDHVYLSVGHQQMMTSALKPLGLSMRQLTALRPMFTAAGRQFVDISQQVSTAAGRTALLTAMEQHDPLMKDALERVLESGFIKLAPAEEKGVTSAPSNTTNSPDNFPSSIENDPAIVSELIRSNEASVDELKHAIQSKSGPEVFDFILEDIQEMKKIMTNPQSSVLYMTAMNAYSWINEKIKEWLDEKNVADVLSQSVPNNITSEMGLALLDVADAIRPYPEVIAYLQQVKDDHFMEELPRVKGGEEARDNLLVFLDRYGIRCAGEIDITNARWSEKPTTLIPIILSNIKNFEPGESNRRFKKGLQEALNKEQELIERLRQLPNGEEKAKEVKRVIGIIRNFIGYREYPKYGMMNRYFVYKQSLMKEAEKLAQANVIQNKEDVFYLTFEEFQEAVRTHKVDLKLISQRKAEHRIHQKLNPPRVITSDGEILSGNYKHDLPAGAIAGLAVSSGVVEGRARVILNMEDAALEEGDILVTTFTDPSWTPLFISIKGLVTEVGGLMTHGAVIAREYGLPAVVGVENATAIIQDGQRIRVNGTDGYVEIL
jgi:pyruvate,water dikinase